MKLKISKLGKIESANIELKDLTIICGPNSSNKTWLSYLICNVLEHNFSLVKYGNYSDFMNKSVETFIKNGELKISGEDGCREIRDRLKFVICESKQNLHKYFNVEKSALQELEVELDTDHIKSKVINEDDWTADGILCRVEDNQFIFEKTDEYDSSSEISDQERNILIAIIVYLGTCLDTLVFGKPLLATSERTGALIFQKDLDRTSIALDTMLTSVQNLDISAQEKSKLIQMVSEKVYTADSRVSAPIRANITDVRNAEDIMRGSVASPKNVIEILDKMNGGSFIFNEEIEYVSEHSTNHKIASTSSSIKSLFLIDLYARYKLNRHDVLLIDEPELNLHPSNQRLMAKFIVRLVNAGVKVVITTHSDFLIREISNSIALSADFGDKEQFLAEHGYTTYDTLSTNQVAAYSVSSNGKFGTMDVTKYGINSHIFDEEINKANDLQDEILMKVEPSLFED